MLDTQPRPIVFAHRGASAYAPENTLEAFRLAYRQGADGIELDAKLSADGEVVVIHDAGVERTTDGNGRVASLELSQLRSLNAGISHPNEFNNVHIPTLSEVFEAVGQNGIINIELTNYSTPHDLLVEKVCDLVIRHGLQMRVLFSSFLGRNLSKAADRLPEVPRGLLALPGWKGVWPRSFGFMFGDYQALHAHVSDIEQQQIQRVHRLRRRIHVWTVNNPDDIRRLNDWGIDGLFTDDPLLTLRALGRTG